MHRIVLVALIGLMCSCPANAQKYTSPAQDLFDQAAYYLQMQYFGPSTVNIPGLVAKYQLEVDQVCASTQTQCSYETIEPLIAAMLGDLGDLHAHYLSPAQLAAEQQQSTGTVTTPRPAMGFGHAAFATYQNQIVMVGGLSPAVLDLVNRGEIKFQSFDRLILNVVAGSPAEKAGFRYGDRWVGYNGTTFSSFSNLGDYAAFLAALTTKIQAQEKIVFNLVRGLNKTPVNIEATGEIINAAPFPTMIIDENNIAMLRIPLFFVLGVGQRVHDLVREAMQKNVKAIVLNLRGTPGGFLHESALAVGAFVGNIETIRFVPRYNADRDTSEYVWLKDAATVVVRNARSGAETVRYTINNPVLYTGPLAVLADAGCASACEYMVNQLQRTKRGPFLGAATAGVADTNTFRFKLINGGAASMPTLRAFWLDGKPLPSKLVPEVTTPDVEFGLFSTGRDGGVEKALELLGVKMAGQNSVFSSAPVDVPFSARDARWWRQPAQD